MTLDFITLTVAGGLVAFVSGLLLLFAWAQYEGGRAALKLGVSHLIGAAAIMLLALSAQNAFLTFLAQPAFVLAAFLVLSATLSFDNRKTPLWLFATAAVAIMAMFWLNRASGDTNLVRLLQLATIVPLFLLSAAVLWQGRSEGLRGRLPLAAVLAMHSLVNGVGLVEVILSEALPTGIPSLSNWYGLIHVESMVYFIGTALFMIALLKERSESRHRIASMTDPLTGLPNRRAFFTACERILERRRSNAPATVLAIDLDRFKAVNDTFGHAIGDRILEVFAAVAREKLRSFDLIGRLGGEEFAVLLPRTHGRQGADVADRLRSAFSDAALTVDGRDVHATLSVGVAVVTGADATIADSLERADAALYRAKLNGRDCVELDAGGRHVRLVG